MADVTNYLTDTMISALEGAVGDSGMSVDNKQTMWLALAELRERRASQGRTLQPGQVAVDEVVLREMVRRLAERTCVLWSEADEEERGLLARLGLAAPETEVPR